MVEHDTLPHSSFDEPQISKRKRDKDEKYVALSIIFYSNQ